MKKFFGFTLTETLVMVGIIASLAIITFSSFSSITPDKEAFLVKKAYNETVTAVQTLLNDEELYSRYYAAYSLNSTYLNSSATYESDDTDNYTTIDDDSVSSEISTSETELSDSDIAPNKTHNDNLVSVGKDVFKNLSIPTGVTSFTKYNKFSYNFAKLFNSTITKSGTNDAICSFTTKDGINWTITDKFNDSDNSTVLIDVNGSQNEGTYTFTIYTDGKITPDSSAAQYLKQGYKS